VIFVASGADEHHVTVSRFESRFAAETALGFETQHAGRRGYFEGFEQRALDFVHVAVALRLPDTVERFGFEQERSAD